MQKISIQISSRYEQCCLIAFEHPYYEEGRCSDLQVMPQNPTKALLRQLGLLFRPISGGMLLLYEDTSEKGPPLGRIKEVHTLSFDLRLENALFYEFTKLPRPPEGQAFHFSNWAAQRPGGKQLPLCQEGQVTQADAYPFQPPRFYYRLQEAYSGSYRIENERGEEVLQESVEQAPGLDINLRDEPNGLYQLLLDGQPPFRFYRHYAPDNLMGCIDIHIEPAVNHVYSLLVDKELQARTFTLPFERRVLPCRYYFLNKNEEVPHTKHQITDADRQVKFTTAKEITLTNGLSAVQIESKTAIPLAERPSQRFLLKTRQGRNKAVVERELPQPSAKLVRPANAISDELCIEQIIYL